MGHSRALWLTIVDLRFSAHAGISRRGGVLRLSSGPFRPLSGRARCWSPRTCACGTPLSHRDRPLGRLIDSPGDIRGFGFPIGTAWPFHRRHRIEPFDPSVQLRIGLRLQSQHRLVRIAVQSERGRECGFDLLAVCSQSNKCGPQPSIVQLKQLTLDIEVTPSRLLADGIHIAKKLEDSISEVKTCDDRPSL